MALTLPNQSSNQGRCVTADAALSALRLSALHIYNNAHLVSLFLTMAADRCFQLMFEALLPGAKP